MKEQKNCDTLSLIPHNLTSAVINVRESGQAAGLVKVMQKKILILFVRKEVGLG